MGYPPIPGLNPVLIPETATVASYVHGRQKASIGQIAAEAGSYMSKLDFLSLPLELREEIVDVLLLTMKVMLLGRYFKFHLIVKEAQMAVDMILWGYGICLPSRYVNDLIKNRDIH